MISASHHLDDQRGASVSVLVAACIPAFVLTCGLAVDGSARLSAQRETTVVAAQAARTGTDAWATGRLGGRPDPDDAIDAARAVLDGHPGISADVGVDASGRLTVRTWRVVDTQFLSVVGIHQFTVGGQATAELRPA